MSKCTITVDLAHKLIAEQFPEYSHLLILLEEDKAPALRSDDRYKAVLRDLCREN